MTQIVAKIMTMRIRTNLLFFWRLFVLILETLKFLSNFIDSAGIFCRRNFHRRNFRRRSFRQKKMPNGLFAENSPKSSLQARPEVDGNQKSVNIGLVRKTEKE